MHERRRSPRPWLALIAAASSALLGGAVSGGASASEPETPLRPAATLGIGPLDPFDSGEGGAPLAAALGGLGQVFVYTAPIPWGRLEPAPPRAGQRTYDFATLDDAVLAWQLAGFDPVLVLSPESPWATVPTPEGAYAKELARRLPAAEARILLLEATGAGPPRSDMWMGWARFVREVVERYDHDGRADMPGLLRGVRHIQILDELESPQAWTGSLVQYQKLLQMAGTAAREADARVRIVSAAIDVGGFAYAPHPDRATWRERADEAQPPVPAAARFLAGRKADAVEALLDFPTLYDVLCQRGSSSLRDDASNLAYLRRELDGAGASRVGLWLVGGPYAKLAAARDPHAPRFDRHAAERRRMAETQADGGALPARDAARLWLARGAAFDVSRNALAARAAGADAVLWASSFAGRSHAGSGEALGLLEWSAQGKPAHEAAGEGDPELVRTPAWHALRQLSAWFTGPHRVREKELVAGQRLYVVVREPHDALPWWAAFIGAPETPWPDLEPSAGPAPRVTIVLPGGRYRVTTPALGADAARSTSPQPVQGAPQADEPNATVLVERGFLELTARDWPQFFLPLPGTSEPR